MINSHNVGEIVDGTMAEKQFFVGILSDSEKAILNEYLLFVIGHTSLKDR